MKVIERTLIHAGMVLDGTGRRIAPAALLLEGDEVLAAGSPQSIGCVSAGPLQVRSLPDRVLIPALVNAHAHLDLSHIGTVAYDGDFIRWVDLIRDRRAMTPQSVAESVRLGAQYSVAGGTAFIGDIAGIGSFAAVEALWESPMRGVSYVELFGQGKPEKLSAAQAIIRAAAETIERDHRGVRIGLQPHAPYSCAKRVYEAAVEADLPLATHLAETLDEIAFTHDPGSSAFAALLKARGVWDDSIVGYGCHPLEALADVLCRRPFVAAHLNYVEDRHVELLAQWPISVAYCPRASAYFGHGVGCPDANPAHRYVEMLQAGVNVALGTDSILCLDTPDRISVLDEMRLLYQRDRTDPATLLRMATINGARALEIEERLVTFDPGPIGGVLALRFDPDDARDGFTQALSRNEAPEWIIGPATANMPRVQP